MPSEAYDRARRLLVDSHSAGAANAARVLGVAQAILLLGLLGVAGLLVELVTTRGSTQLPEGLLGIGSWVESRATGHRPGTVTISDSGLFPLVAANYASRNPVHALGARILLRLLNALPNLRSNIGALSFLVSLALAHILLLAWSSRVRRSAMAEAACSVAATLRKQVHRQMYRLGQSSLPTEGTGPVVNLFTREVNDVRDGLFAQLDVAWRIPVIGVGLVLLLLLVAWKTSIMLACVGALVWLAQTQLRKSSETIAVGAVRDAALELSVLQEDLSLLRIVRVHGMEIVDKTRFDEHLDRYTKDDIRRITSEEHGRTVLFLLYASAIVAAVGVLAYGVVVNGHSPTSAMFVIASLVGLAVPPGEWHRMNKSIRQADRSSRSIFEYIDRTPELHQAGGALFLPPMRDRITFENVTLDSSSGRRLLDGFSVEIKKGSRVAVMGLDEDAKYALVCLIPRLIDPKVGRVRIDGMDLRDVTLESIRAQVSTVLHADLVFSDTVFANIGLGDPSFELPRVIEAAKLAHAHSFIQDLPQGYETSIGPLGHYLTGDQQYRIGLARAALHDPSIMIIEEPITPLDDEVKPFLDDTIARLSAGRTLIILPHRLSTIRSCDQVIVIQGGHLEATGPPREIHAASKLYRHIQYMEFNQFATGEVEAGQMNG